jgi:hypothetical protein
MKSWNILSVLMLAGALMTSPSYAGDQGAGPAIPDDRLPHTQGDTRMHQGMPGGSMNGTETPAAKSVEGTIAAVDRESGRFVLDTSEGPISLVTTPDELAGVQIGDVVRVSLMMDEGE